MLNIGVIGFGGRIADVFKELLKLEEPVRVAAVVDPREKELRERHASLLKGAEFRPDVPSLLSTPGLDGIMIGTRCSLHAELASAAAPRGLPLFLEKPVAISFDQVRKLAAAFSGKHAPVVVSFPLRVSPLCRRARELVDSGAIGRVEHAVAFNDVPYGDVYFGGWYRDYDETGGLFLQKATHDIDYLTYLVASRPRRVMAMKSRRVWGGNKPYELACVDCPEKASCPESPYNPECMMSPGSAREWGKWRKCLFAEKIRNEDSGNALLEYENGVQVSYTQNFFARFSAARRGTRLYGYKGTLEFDWYTNKISLFRHGRPETIIEDLSGKSEHFGGDAELCKDFIAIMKGGKESATPIEAGIESALTCLWARESAETGRACDIVMPA